MEGNSRGRQEEEEEEEEEEAVPGDSSMAGSCLTDPFEDATATTEKGNSGSVKVKFSQGHLRRFHQAGICRYTQGQPNLEQFGRHRAEQLWIPEEQ